jgi:hypothetical protein
MRRNNITSGINTVGRPLKYLKIKACGMGLSGRYGGPGDYYYSKTLCERLVSAAQIPEPVFLNVYGAQKSIPSNEFFQPT